jgi:DNA-binding SARP family transcriptional activator
VQTTPTLRLLVLGPPRIERAGKPVELNLRRALALLAYLAVDERPHGRDALAALLWPDADERDGRARFRRTLHRLTEALGDDLLLAEGDTLRLSPAADLWVDCRAFERHAAAGLTPGAPEAANLYADDFLAGFSLPDSPAWDEWQFLHREHLRQTAARVLERLTQTRAGEAQWESAAEHARRWLALDPTNEPAHRLLMEIYAGAG